MIFKKLGDFVKKVISLQVYSSNKDMSMTLWKYKIESHSPILVSKRMLKYLHYVKCQNSWGSLINVNIFIQNIQMQLIHKKK